ncbi:hypothetical protein QBC32DRAFT_319557 [Pseudoneurospora amorphoporcata]|uniref:Uncharacterized protein n=1 Tax=Pseudoneurospora amorphoporcata TaxID=241081 RepID=A0AAN6NML8_9PEZI|nr:hypothetical protein QBC32DRAFT_319557 [Pseudoneurospora amorphoporcata]
MENADNTEPNAPENRRMTRGMRAAGGVIPPVAPRVKKPKVTQIKREDPEDDDGKSQGSQQPSAQPKKEKAPSFDSSDPWTCVHMTFLPSTTLVIRLLTRDYTKTPRDDELIEAAHKYKWRAIRKHTLRELKTITVTEQRQARKKLKENPRDGLQQIKLNLLKAITSHIRTEYSDSMYAKWREGRDKVRMN